MAGKLFSIYGSSIIFSDLFCCVFISTANPVLSADYYISNDGSDGNNGTSISTHGLLCKSEFSDGFICQVIKFFSEEEIHSSDR
ncbi:MAG: hypothetical protein IPM38_11445 [Ignavibacteria bacterium]|nr:hypothetical protein [Ignavibacteria bacterium]